MEAIRDNHVAQGLSHPRPNMLCPNCGDIGILCWGEAIRLHLRHAVENGCSGYYGESSDHARAKELLKGYLLTGGKIDTKGKSCSCKRTKELRELRYFMEPKSEILLEHAYNGIVLDLACVSNGAVIFGVEIYKTHKTSTVSERSAISWFEVKAEQVIYLLEGKDAPKLIPLDDLRDDIWTKCGYCQSAKTYTMDELARELGYKQVTSPYPTESRKLVDHCWGHYNERESWKLKSITSDNMLWSQFLSKRECMKCLKRHDTVKFKPFCGKCYRDINEEPNSQIKIEVSDEEKVRCRKLFSWLNNVPGDWSLGVECHGCKRNYETIEETDAFEKYRDPNSNIVKGCTWWFGDKKRCCTVCLEERYQNSTK